MATIYSKLATLQIRKKSAEARKYIPAKYLKGQVRISFTDSEKPVTVNQIKMVKPISPLNLIVWYPNDTAKVFYYSVEDLINKKYNTLTNQHGGQAVDSNTYIMNVNHLGEDNLAGVIDFKKTLTPQQLNGQYYTTNVNQILSGFESLVKGKDVVDYTAGQHDLLNWASANGAKSVCGYDIDEGHGNIVQDTLMNPVNLPSYFVISNPPFLRKYGTRTAIHLPIYEKYNTDNLYKAHIMSLTNKEGIMIIPANFLSEACTKTRDWFFKRYSITTCKLFAYKVFDDADLSVIAFHYIKNKNTPASTSFTCEIHSNTGVDIREVSLRARNGWIAGGAYLDNLSMANIKVEKVKAQEQANTNIYIQTVQGGRLRWGATYSDICPTAAVCDLVTMRINLPSTTLTKSQQQKVVDEFNKTLDYMTKEFGSLPFSNYVEAGKMIISKTILSKMLSAAIEKVAGVENPTRNLFDWDLTTK